MIILPRHLQSKLDRMTEGGRNPAHCEVEAIGIAIVTALFTAEAAGTVIVAGLTVGSLVGTVVVGAAIAGAQYALSATLTDRADAFSTGDVGIAGINAPDVKGSVQQSAPAQRIIYGRVDRVGGAVYLLDDSSPPALRLGLLLSRRKISFFRSLLIGENIVPFAALSHNVIVQPLPAVGQNYIKGSAARLFVCARDGRANQTTSALWAARLGYDANFKQSGIATLDCEFLYGSDRTDFEATWGQVSIPNVLANVDGATVYDPRDPTQVKVSDWRDQDNVAAAMATWKFSRNASLIQADWLGLPEGGKYPVDRIRWDAVAAAADYDDQPIYNKDGTSTPRYTIDGVVTLNQKPREVMEAMLTANRGFLVESRGKGWVTSSPPLDPVMTITDSMMRQGYEFRDSRALKDLVNQVITRFPSSDRQGQDVDGPVLERSDLEDDDGELLSQTLRTPFTVDHRVLQRLSKQYLALSRLERAWTGAISLRGIGLNAGDCVRIESRLFPRMNGLYSIDQMGYLDDFSGVTLTLNEYDPTISTAWDAAVDEQDFTLPAVAA